MRTKPGDGSSGSTRRGSERRVVILIPFLMSSPSMSNYILLRGPMSEICTQLAGISFGACGLQSLRDRDPDSRWPDCIFCASHKKKKVDLLRLDHETRTKDNLNENSIYPSITPAEC
jgi:hypothetical protein